MKLFHRIANLFSRSKIDQEIHDDPSGLSAKVGDCTRV
jgi:hypothetical protein